MLKEALGRAVAIRDIDNMECPFCKMPAPNSTEEGIDRLRKRVDAGDANNI